ncbi:MAG TPA: ABC transporter permease, partial [Bacteroidales bacterium]|nr:ABC transporter permease [Bacteroidales bacterium]
NAEDGQALNIIMCAGLKSSFFQGNLIIHENDMARYFPSVAGSSLFLFDGKEELLSTYLEVLGQRFYNIGFLAMDAGQKLASFLEVTNTYLSVFSIMGIFGLILGVTGFGFILLRIFNIRRREFALMSATGYSLRDIRRYILNDQVLILTWGILTGVSSGLVATIPSFRGGNEIPWLTITLMVLLLIATGVITLAVSLRGVRNEVLISQLRNE